MTGSVRCRALHLVAVRHGPGVAARIAREMVVYARRDGDERQASAMFRYRSHLSDMVHRIQDLVGHGATVEATARQVGFEDARMLRRLRVRSG